MTGSRRHPWLWAMILVAGCQRCRACDPELPDDTDTEETEDTAPIVDTSVEPPCAVPEVEPNEATATPIPLEVQGCGEFQAALDFDRWTFTPARPAWIALIVESTSIGSQADTNVILTAGTDATEMRDWEGGQDVRLVIPVSPVTYTALVTEASGQGGTDRYYYDLLVTEVKEPVEWTTTETAADNDELADATELVDGDAVFGLSDGANDVDAYFVRVPAGAHTVTFDVDAYSYGSPGDFRLFLYNAGGTQIGQARYGEQGFELDPWLSYASSGDETLVVTVREESGRGGSAWWYRLAVELKGDT